MTEHMFMCSVILVFEQFLVFEHYRATNLHSISSSKVESFAVLHVAIDSDDSDA